MQLVFKMPIHDLYVCGNIKKKVQMKQVAVLPCCYA